MKIFFGTLLFFGGMLSVCMSYSQVGGDTLVLGKDLTNCMYSVTVGDEVMSPEHCEINAINEYFDNNLIEQAALYLGLDIKDIRFRGCDNLRYSASKMLPGSNLNFIYEITYKLNSVTPRIAPIIHELAHIFQLEKYGDSTTLRENMGSLRSELEADYITGALFFHLKIDKNIFQYSWDLVGFYDESAEQNPHGAPSQRTTSFRMGYFFARSHANASIENISEQFHREAFHSVIGS